MKRNIVIKELKESLLEKKEVEIVERKGIGHPDYICDAVCEAASQALSKYYLRKFGVIFHHNLDKGLLIAGKSQSRFGGGKILEPIKIIIAGRATEKVGKFKIPVKEIVKKSVQNCLVRILNFPKKQIERDFRISVNYKPGAANLRILFKEKNKVALANDTSFGVAHSPLSETEKITLNLANLINSKNFSKKFPFVGKDIKVMALRKKEKLSLTLAIAFIDKFIKNVKEYFENKEKVKREIKNYIRKNSNFKSFKVEINVLDNPKAKDESEIYLTYSGLSAEQGDDGQVGRGNRVCGLITPCRQMSLEATAGKNINHPGKLYQILSFLIAREIGKIEGVQECYVKILSEIGKPLDLPQIALIELKAENFLKTKEKVLAICEKNFNNLRKIQENIVKGKYLLF